tara:strand:- start:72 stop:455 length:384 start_codon:yes stop_codon:yes gene_type:complete
MKHTISDSLIKVRNLTLWSHVGVLEEEREYGQQFIVDLYMWSDVIKASKNDDLESTLDYSLAITSIQNIARTIHCKTIECFSDKILDCLEEIYGPIPMTLSLTKTQPPIQGFNGTVAIERSRNLNLD